MNNEAHLHLMIVHFPVVLIPLGAILLALGIWRRDLTLRSTAYCIFVAGAALAGAAFWFGEGAEEIVEDALGAVESAIDGHEEAANFALWVTVALGVGSLGALLIGKSNSRLAARFGLPLLTLAVISSGALGYTAQEGGKIRHPEAFAATVAEATSEAGGHE